MLFIENGSTLSAEDFKTEEDIYVVDEQFTWTYVATHEQEFL